MVRILKTNGKGGIYGSHFPSPTTTFLCHVASFFFFFHFWWFIPISIKISYTFFVSCVFSLLKSKKQSFPLTPLDSFSNFFSAKLFYKLVFTLFPLPLPILSWTHANHTFIPTIPLRILTLLSNQGHCYFLWSFWIPILLDLSTAFDRWPLSPF